MKIQAQMALKTKCMFLHSWQAKQVSPVKPHVRLDMDAPRVPGPALTVVKLPLDYI